MTKIKPKDQTNTEKLAFAPPEPRYISESYILKLPLADRHFKSPWHLRLYAARLLERQVGDQVQLTSLKVKKPRLVAKSAARLRRRPALARLYVTVKF